MLTKITKTDAKFLMSNFGGMISFFLLSIDKRWRTSSPDQKNAFGQLFPLVPHALGKIADLKEYQYQFAGQNKYIYDGHLAEDSKKYPQNADFYSRDPQEFLSKFLKKWTIAEFNNAATQIEGVSTSSTYESGIGVSDFNLLISTGTLLYSSARDLCEIGEFYAHLLACAGEKVHT